MQRKDSRERGEHGKLQIQKVKATIIFAVITFLATTFGLELDNQTETLINALVPVIVAVIIPQPQGFGESSQDSDRVQ